MSSTFTPSDAINMSNEKDWSANLGMLDWDSTNIVFTKRSLTEFLKTQGVTIDTNWSNVQKLPKYAKFGKMSSSEATDSITPSTSANVAGATATSDSTGGYKPSRRVRDLPGGGHTDIFGNNDEDDALSKAPRKETDNAEPTTVSPSASQNAAEEDEHTGINFTSHVKPSRRVRTNPGGNSSLGNFWDSGEQEEFKPTRRVRQGPGGQDNITGLF